MTAGRLAAAAPAGLLLAVVWADLLLGDESVLLSLVVMVPLLAANLVGPRATAAYGAAALLVAVLMGVHDGLYGPDTLPAQVLRLAAVALGGALAVAASSYRMRRDRRLARVLHVAEVAQRAILLPVPAHLHGVDLAVHYQSAASDARIGGDVYAAATTGFGVRLLVGDVRGKGLDAVRLASQVLAAFRERAGDREDLGTLAEDLDRAVRRVAGPEDFATAVLAQIDATGELTVVNAGHPPPLLLSGGSVTELAPRSPRPPLGLDGVSRSQRHRLGLGDRLLLYTDGLTEARRPRDRGFFPLELVGSTLGTGSLPDGMEALRRALLEWTGGRLSDDVALVAAQRAPGGGGQSCSSTESTLPAGSVNHAIAGPLPRITPLSSWPNPG